MLIIRLLIIILEEMTTNTTDGYQVAMLIRDINTKLTNNINREFKDTGLTLPQINVIKILAAHKKLKVSELGMEMGLTNATVSSLLDRLEKQNLIRRERSANDRRVVYVQLTEDGVTLIKNSRETVRNYFQTLFQDCSKEEMLTIIQGLKIVQGIVSK